MYNFIFEYGTFTLNKRLIWPFLILVSISAIVSVIDICNPSYQLDFIKPGIPPSPAISLN